MATWAEILGGLCLFFGLFTRFWAFSLIIVSIVAISGVHWPDDWNSLGELWKGYAISNKGFGNYRVPLLFIAMLIPLVFQGPGKLSIDRLLAKKFS
jgi:putative oxidoreductase